MPCCCHSSSRRIAASCARICPAAPTRGSIHEEDGTHRACTHRLGRNPLEGERAVAFVFFGIGEQTSGSRAPEELTAAARFCRPFMLLADGPTEAGTTRLQRLADDPPATPGRPHAPQSSTQRADPAGRRHCPGDTPATPPRTPRPPRAALFSPPVRRASSPTAPRPFPAPDGREVAATVSVVRAQATPLPTSQAQHSASLTRKRVRSMSLPPLHIPPDGGSPVFLVGDTYTTLLSAADTGGELSLAEAVVPADAGPPAAHPPWRVRDVRSS